MAVNWVEVDRLAQAHHLIDATSSEEALTRKLRLWWCIKYTRPFRDPLLDTYTLDELVYEYLVWFYMDPENDPLEQQKKEAQVNSDEEWAKEQLLKMKEASIKKSQEIPNHSKDSEKIPESTPIPDLPEISTSFEK